MRQLWSPQSKNGFGSISPKSREPNPLVTTQILQNQYFFGIKDSIGFTNRDYWFPPLEIQANKANNYEIGGKWMTKWMCWELAINRRLSNFLKNCGYDLTSEMDLLWGRFQNLFCPMIIPWWRGWPVEFWPLQIKNIFRPAPGFVHGFSAFFHLSFSAISPTNN